MLVRILWKRNFVYLYLSYLVANDANQQTSVCRVDISPSRGRNVPCSPDLSSVFTYNANGVSSSATTNLGLICSIACKNYNFSFN